MYELAHTGIVVSDLEKSVAFYTGPLECEISGKLENERLNIVYLKAGNSIIELLKYKVVETEKRGRGVVDHIAFFVSNMEVSLEKVKAAGAEMLQDAIRDMGHQRVMFFAGPDGERIEFVEPKSMNK
jgi:lactoylglutathione lyase